MRLGIETRLNHYKILGLLGEGGMGEVYRALDTTLKREVAIKVLPSRLASDPAALAWFEREAVVLAALNHAGFSASKTGRLAFASGGATVPLGIPGMMHGQLTWLNRDGKTLSKLNT